jgi:hypothetical protein
MLERLCCGDRQGLEITAPPIPAPPAWRSLQPCEIPIPRSMMRGHTRPRIKPRLDKQLPLTSRSPTLRRRCQAGDKAPSKLANRCTFAEFSDGNEVVRGSTNVALGKESFRAASVRGY